MDKTRTGSTVIISTLVVFASGACASSPTGPAIPEIEVRSASGAPVAGTAFTCTPAAVRTPCDAPFGQQRSSIYVSSAAEDIVRVQLSRNSDVSVVDGPSATAVLELQFRSDQPVAVNAKQVRGGWQYEEQFPRDGWIEPVVTSPTPDGRNAGRFSLTFDWGTIQGTYDSADAPPPLPPE